MSMAGEFNELRKVSVTINCFLQIEAFCHLVHRFSGESKRVEDNGGHDSKNKVSLTVQTSKQMAEWSSSTDDVIRLLYD